MEYTSSDDHRLYIELILLNRRMEKMVDPLVDLLKRLKLNHGGFRTYFRMCVGQFVELLVPNLKKKTSEF